MCSVEEFPDRHGCGGSLSCPGDTLQEAHESLVEICAPNQVPPLREFTEEIETYTPGYSDLLSSVMKKVAQTVSPSSLEYPQDLMDEIRRIKENKTN